MDYRKQSAKNAERSGKWISIIGAIIVLVGVILCIAGFENAPFETVPTLLIMGISVFISGIITIGFGNGLKCLADILESNYRTYKILAQDNQTDHITDE